MSIGLFLFCVLPINEIDTSGLKEYLLLQVSSDIIWMLLKLRH